MTRLFPALSELYLLDSSVDLYLGTLREAMQSLPSKVLQLEYGCHLIITDFTNTKEAENCGIVLGHGYHHSEFLEKGRDRPTEGLVFCLNPPYVEGVTDIKMHATKHGEGVIPVRSSFMVGPNRFLLTAQEFNLDEIRCGILRTGEVYKKIEPSNEFPE